jgi:hypothetical protein
LVLLLDDFKVRHAGQGWKAGGTLCFYRKLWQRRAFRNVPHSEDFWFLEDHQPRISLVSAADFYILVRHRRNTWKTLARGEPTDAFFRRLPPYPRPLKTLVHPEDFQFYESLRHQLWNSAPR